MKMHKIRILALGSAVALGLAMLPALTASPLLAAQTRSRQHAHPLPVQPRSSGYGVVSGRPAYIPVPLYGGDPNVNRDNSVNRP